MFHPFWYAVEAQAAGLRNPFKVQDVEDDPHTAKTIDGVANLGIRLPLVSEEVEAAAASTGAATEAVILGIGSAV